MFLHIVFRFFWEIGDIVIKFPFACFSFLRSFENISEMNGSFCSFSDADFAVWIEFQMAAKCRHRNRETHSILFRCYSYTDLFIFFIIIVVPTGF